MKGGTGTAEPSGGVEVDDDNIDRENRNEPKAAKQVFRLDAFVSPMRIFKAREWHQIKITEVDDNEHPVTEPNNQLERQLVVTSDQLLILQVSFCCVLLAKKSSCVLKVNVTTTGVYQ